MAIYVRCQQCGKGSQFANSDAGMTALCIACGARFTIPTDFQDTARLEAARANGNGNGDEVPPILRAARDAPPRYVSTPVVGRGPLYGLLAGAIAVVILIGVGLFSALRPEWEFENALQIRQLKSQAEAQVLSGRLDEAYQSYRKIDDLVGIRQIGDRELREQVATARAAREKLFETLFTQARQQYASASGSNSLPPVSTQKPAAQTQAADPLADATTIRGSYEPEGFRKPVRIDTPPVAEKPIEAPKPPEVIPRGTGHDNPPPAAAAAVTFKTPEQRGIRMPELRPGEFRRYQPRPDAGVSDEQIGKAIHLAVEHLLMRFDDGALRGGNRQGDSYQSGLNALCVYALLQSSYAIKDERLNTKGTLVRQMIDKMKKSPMETGYVTYARGIRATALSLLNRPEDKEALRADVNYLLNSHNAGAYTYAALPRSLGRNNNPVEIWDNSNAQYGLLGVWSGAEVGMEVNSSYWQAVDSHWTRSQNDDGSWSYAGYNRRGDGLGRITMTLAGTASLFVTHDYLDAPRFGAQVGRDPFSPSLRKALAHLESGNTAINVNGGYGLYGLERVGLASGFKYFGNHDWYRVLARAVVESQHDNGSWGSDLETAFHLLFLARGRHPIVMNKLRYDGAWANRPRDVANLARFGSRELERQLNWQVVPIDRDWTDWCDSPILYIASHQAPKFTDEQVAKIRGFVQAGGMLFTQADGAAPAASIGFEELAKRLFPNYEMRNLPDDHDILNILYKPSPRPTLRCMTNGSRILVLHSPSDIAQHWQLRADKTRRSLFELGVNIFLYAAGKVDLRNRLASPYIPPQGEAQGGTIRVLRLKYPGNWDPEPMAWTRFARYFQFQTDVALDVTTANLFELPAAGNGNPQTTIAHLTGASPYSFTAAEVEAIKKYVEAGGILLIDVTGGAGDFPESVRAALGNAFGQQPAFLPREHPMLTGKGLAAADDVSTSLLRPYLRFRNAVGRIEHISAGKGKVFFTPLDLTTGLLGANTWTIAGFNADYSSALVKNILVWNAMGRKEE